MTDEKRFLFVLAIGVLLTINIGFGEETSETSYDINVLVIKYFPLTADSQNINITVTGDVGESYSAIRQRTIDVTSNLKASLEKASTYLGYKDADAKPALSYNIIDTKEYTQAVPIKARPGKPTYPDYYGIMQAHNICNYVENQSVKEVWLWAYQGPGPQLAIYESKMSGPLGDISNSGRENDMPVCKNTYRVYTFNYQRGTSEALESWGHQMESELSAVDSNLFRNLFQGPAYPQKWNMTGRCGSVHNPPNSLGEYNRDNPVPQKSDCLDWNPDGLGALTNISCQNWGCQGDPSLYYQIWNWQNLPGRNNLKTFLNKQLRNWWDVHGDFDNVMANSKRLTLAATVNSTGGVTCKTFGGNVYIASDGTGYIGCDIEVSGSFDLSKSYCQGQKTTRKEFLKPDGYGRANRYYATLTGLDPKEEVRVFIVSNSSEKIECLPVLNKQISVSCTDSDGGKDYYTQGKCVDSSRNGKEDTCYAITEQVNPSPTHLQEVYCNSSNVCTTELYKCPNGCKDGACIKETSNQTCTDSDGGKDYYTRGSVSVCSSSSGTGGGSGTCAIAMDSCDGNRLIEKYCDGNKAATENYNCPNGCVDGACIKPECHSDNDCPQITCIQAPCPVNRCEDGKCVLSSCGNGICEPGEADDCPVCNPGQVCSLRPCYMGSCQQDCEAKASVYAYMQTDKYKYKPHEYVEITATAYGNRNDGSDLENIDLTAIVKSPGVNIDKIKMNRNSIACPVSEQTSTNEEIISSETQVSSSEKPISSEAILPIGCIATYTAAYQGAKTTGFYGVGGESSHPNVIVSGTSFEVFDPALLEKYLILDDIGGYKYVNAQSSESSADYILYTATYEKDSEGFAAGVAQFNSEESLKKALNEILRNYNDKIRKEVINGNMVYVIEDSYQQVTFWTSKNFIVFVMKSSEVSQTREEIAIQSISKKSVTTTQALSAAKPTSSIKALAKPTGMAVRTTPSSLGTATTSSSGSGRGGKICPVPEEIICKMGMRSVPVYGDDGCVKEYKCVYVSAELPVPLIKAYLDKYPSDLSAIGTQCESKKGYCISFDSDCRRGYAESSLSCNSNSEKCCVKEVSMGDIMEIVVKLDSLKNVFKQMQQESGAMADYYDSIGDSANAKKYHEVSDMFGTAADKTSSILQKIKDNLDNPDAIMDEVKKDIQSLKDYIKEIIKKIIGE